MRTILIIILMSGVLYSQRINPLPDQSDYDAANEWVVKNMAPILVRQYNDPREIPAVKSRIAKLSELQAAEKIGHIAMPTLHPKMPNVQAHVDFDLKKRRPVLMIFVPPMQDLQRRLSRKNFEDMVVLIYVHEVIHIELHLSGEDPLRPNQSTLLEDSRSEALAFGKTIIEIVRPWSKQGRVPDQDFAKASIELSKFNDNYRDPRWIAAFMDYYRK